MPGRGICIAIVVYLALLASPALAQEVTVAGNRFLRDGKPWVAEGVSLVGLISPAAMVANNPTYGAARAAFGPGMLDEVKRYGADLVRYQVSQTALDPESKHFDPRYRDEVLAGIAMTREAGLNIIVAMQWKGQGVAGRRDPTGLPTATTRRAWLSILDPLAEDRGVLLEIFNEPPLNPRTTAEWVPWQESMQGLIDALRDAGAQNVLLVPGTQFSRYLAGAPAPDDPLGQLGYAVHPYLGKHNQTRPQWNKRWGDFARTHPVMATEFNAYYGGGYCRPELAVQAEEILAYMREKRIGVVVWAFDTLSVRAPDGGYTTLDDLVCGERRDGGQGGAGQMIHEYFLAK